MTKYDNIIYMISGFCLVFYMSKLIYIDTNVWLDYLFNRSDGLRPLGDFAFELFRKSIECQYSIIISDWLIDEIKNNQQEKAFRDFEKILQKNKKVMYIKTTQNEISTTKQSENWPDKLHEILAQNARAAYLVTRNKKDFTQSCIPIVFPEEL